MSENPIKRKLAAGGVAVGIWCIIPSPLFVESLALGGLDFLILDMEHGVFGPDGLESCVRAAEAGGAAPLVRIPGLDAAAAQTALDLGAYGIIVPQVTGLAQATAAVQYTKYFPQGSRGYNPFTRAGRFGNVQQAASNKLDNAFGFISVIVESRGAIDELDAICALPALDMIYVGIYDLSVSLGFGGNVNHPDLQSLLTSIVTTVRAHGKAAGMMVKNAAEARQAVALGANVLMFGVDTFLVSKTAAAIAALTSDAPPKSKFLPDLS